MFHWDFFHVTAKKKKKPHSKRATTITTTTYVFAITSNDQISYYTLTVLSPSLRWLHFMLTPLQNDMVFLEHSNRIPVTVLIWSVYIGSPNTQNSGLSVPVNLLTGATAVLKLALFFVWVRCGGGGTYEGCYLIATEHFIHIPFVISEALSR